MNDYDIDDYSPQMQAFLTRRRMTKREIRKFVIDPCSIIYIAPKCYIMNNMGDEYRDTYH